MPMRMKVETGSKEFQQSCTVEHVKLTTKLGSTGRGNSKKTLDQVELWYTMWHKDDTEVFVWKKLENIMQKIQ